MEDMRAEYTPWEAMVSQTIVFTNEYPFPVSFYTQTHGIDADAAMHTAKVHVKMKIEREELSVRRSTPEPGSDTSGT